MRAARSSGTANVTTAGTAPTIPNEIAAHAARARLKVLTVERPDAADVVLMTDDWADMVAPLVCGPDWAGHLEARDTRDPGDRAYDPPRRAVWKGCASPLTAKTSGVK
jgi:hypothetical protein